MLEGKKHVRGFEARSENGAVHTLHVYEDIIAVPHAIAASDAAVPGLPSFATADDQPVWRLDKGKYQVAATGEILNSDDPDAP